MKTASDDDDIACAADILCSFIPASIASSLMSLSTRTSSTRSSFIPRSSSSSSTGPVCARDTRSSRAHRGRHATGAQHQKSKPKPKSKSTQQDTDVYVIERILDHRVDADNGGGWEYLVKWEGYTSSFNLWVPTQNFVNTMATRQYWKDHRV